MLLKIIKCFILIHIFAIHVSITIYGKHHHKYFTYKNLKKFVVINYRQIYDKYLHEDIVHNYKFFRYNLNENRESLN